MNKRKGANIGKYDKNEGAKKVKTPASASGGGGVKKKLNKKNL